MKKSLLFITILAATVAFGVFQKSNTTTNNSQVANEAFKEKWNKKEAKALEFFKYRQEMLKNVETGEVDPQDYYTALAAVEAMQSNNTANKTDVAGLNWTSRGPDSQGGRTRALLFDKDDENLLFTGSVSGGLFKSTDGGNSWARVPSFYNSNSAIMSITQSQDGTIFVGTGETLGGSPTGGLNNVNATGSGIYKSTDLGATWTSIDETNEFTYPTFSGQWSSVRKMAAHPALPSILIAGNNSGLRISTNADIAQPTFSNISGVPGNVSDVAITIDGKDGWAAAGGRIYKSNGTSLSDPWTLKSPNVGASRAQIAVSAVDATGDYIVYASFTTGSGCLAGIFKTEDKGASWIQIVFPGGADPFAQPSSGGGLSGCQGWYDHCIAVNPVDKDKIYIGGITFYTWSSASGGLKRADKIDSEGAKALDPDYIHADKHGIFLSPHDETGNTMFVVGDGGIVKSVNANSGFPDNIVYAEANRDYTTLQCYSIGSGKYGEVFAGAQDNGSQYVDYKGISPRAAKEPSGGDGVAGAFISNFNLDALFSGIYNGNIKRSMDNGASSSNFLDPVIDTGACGHISCSVPISPNTCDDVEGQIFIYPFLLMETFDRLNPKMDAYIYARDETIVQPGGQIVEIKDTIEPGEVIAHTQFKLEKIPKMDFEGLGLSFMLPVQLLPGDTHFFESKINTKYFVPSTCGNAIFFVCTNPVQDGTAPIFYQVNVPGQSGIKKLDYSYDGDMIGGVSGANVVISQGWDEFEPDPNSVVPYNVTSIVNKIIPIGTNNLSGICIDKSDKDRILVSQAGYGGVNKVFLITGATTATPVITSVQGDLPIMPVYSCVIDREDGNKFIVGTELGIFASIDGGTTWTEENSGIGARIPIFDVRQKWVNNFDCNLLSAGTLGGGMFTSESLSSCAGNIIYGRPEPNAINNTPTVQLNSVLVYPNPVSEIAKVAFVLNEKTDITIKIVDLVGKVVLTKEFSGLNAGDQTLELNVSNLASSSYFTVLSSGNRTYGNKMFVKK